MSDLLIGYEEAIMKWNKEHPNDKRNSEVIDEFLFFLYANGFTDGIQDIKLRINNGTNSSK